MSYLTRLITKLAPQIGARVVFEPEWKSVGQIVYKNGVVRSFHFYRLDLNPLASSKIAKDKEFSKFFIKKSGYPVAPGTSIFEKNWAKEVQSKRNILYAKKYAKKLGYPVIVKPNSKSQGFDVCLVYDSKELDGALNKVFKYEKVALVEKYLPGHDYRVVVLDGGIISAYERIPLSIIGDGRSSIKKLLNEKHKLLKLHGRDADLNLKDTRIKSKIKRLGYAFSTILMEGQKIYLLDNANLSTGGDSIDFTKNIHPGFKKIAIQVTRDMGLRMAGVDIMVTKGDITKDTKKSKFYIIEINAAPGLDHYVTTGPAQRKIVEAMYLKVLKALGKKD